MHFEKSVAYYQTGKVRVVPRKPKPFNTVSSNHKGNETSNIMHTPGIFSNPEITSTLAQHAIGNIGEIKTHTGDRIVGVIKAISPQGDIGLAFTYSHKNCSDLTKDALVVPVPDWKTIRISNVKISDCLMNDAKMETEFGSEMDAHGTPSDRELVPFFSGSEDIKDCVLEHGGFPAAEMFKTNEQLFSVSSTYNPDLLEYTTPVDRTAADYSETEARCAQLAKTIEGNQSTRITVDSVYGDEEMAYSAVVRASKKESKNSTCKHIEQGEELKNTAGKMSKLSIDLPKEISVEPAEIVQDDSVDEPKPNETGSTISSSEPTSIPSITCSTTSQSVPMDKPKKSTLDPNAPEFKPMSLQCSSTQVSVAPLQPVASNVINPQVQPLVNFGTPNQIQLQFMTTPQTIYAPRSLAYGSAGGHLAHMLPNAISSLSGVTQHVRGNSLPPSLHQQTFPHLNASSNMIIQPTQPCISVPQIGTSHSALVSGPNPALRYISSPPGALNRQRANESSTPSHSVYGQVPPNNSIPVYHFPWAPHGLHFVPGVAGQSALMIGNSQSSGPVYPTHSLLQMQQQLPMHGMQVDQVPPSTTPQQSQPSVFPIHPGAFQEQAHSIQMPPYTPNIMLTSQQHAPSAYYPTAPTVFGGPTNLNPSAPSGLFTIVNQQPQHSIAGNVGHQPVVDQGLVSTQLSIPSFPTPNYHQPHFLQQYNTAQLLQTQQVNAGHLNPQTIQPGSFHTLAAMVAGGGNSSGQTH